MTDGGRRANKKKPEGPDGDPLVFTLFNELGIIQQLARAEFERMLPDGLHLSHFSVLNHFVRLDRTESPAQLASAFQVTRGAMTNTVGWLDRHGLVTVTPDPSDGRAKIVAITTAGRHMRDKAVAALGNAAQRLESAFPPNEIAEHLPFLQRLRVFLDENRRQLATPPDPT
jgi:DNA-binding MarR family transcriptional regulator